MGIQRRRKRRKATRKSSSSYTQKYTSCFLLSYPFRIFWAKKKARRIISQHIDVDHTPGGRVCGCWNPRFPVCPLPLSFEKNVSHCPIRRGEKKRARLGTKPEQRNKLTPIKHAPRYPLQEPIRSRICLEVRH